MKTTKIITLAVLLTLLAAGCNKDNDGRIRLVVNPMSSGAKIQMSSSDISASAWVENENINLNGTAYTITKDQQDPSKFYLNNVDATGALLAVYPASAPAGNDIVVDYDNGTVTLNRLTVNFTGGGYRVVFPMAASENANATALHFGHLSGGMKITLTNNSGDPITLGGVKIVTRTDNAAGSIVEYNGFTAVWAVQGPSLPSDTVGQITGDVVCKYSSEMHFDLQTNGTAGVTIQNGSSLSFCVPVTVNSVRYLTVTGYGTDGSQRFAKTKDLGTAKVIERNKMYTIPEIEL